MTMVLICTVLFCEGSIDFCSPAHTAQPFGPATISSAQATDDALMMRRARHLLATAPQ
eukprot:COSAG01_NODE_30_length_36127_cov_41.433234_33_plen_58_part_00